MPGKMKAGKKSGKEEHVPLGRVGKKKPKVIANQKLPAENQTKKLKPCGTKHLKRSNEIDELFKEIKKPKNLDSDNDKQMNLESKKELSQPICGSKDDIFGNEAAELRKRTEEGYAIYTEEELGFGKTGGGTDLCPFDCRCCF